MNASLEVIVVVVLLHAGSSGLGVDVEKNVECKVVLALNDPCTLLEREKRGRTLPTAVVILEI